MKHRTKKAACIAAFGYIAVCGLGFGMLKAAQETRRTLYGGTPVMAQVTKPVNPQNHDETYQLMLGGGEWKLSFALPDISENGNAAAQLPPCTGKIFIRMFLLADQTAEWIAGEYDSGFSF